VLCTSVDTMGRKLAQNQHSVIVFALGWGGMSKPIYHNLSRPTLKEIHNPAASDIEPETSGSRLCVNFGTVDQLTNADQSG
jgi:hypothetical protein